MNPQRLKGNFQGFNRDVPGRSNGRCGGATKVGMGFSGDPTGGIPSLEKVGELLHPGRCSSAYERLAQKVKRSIHYAPWQWPSGNGVRIV